jgi:two-component system, NtrC family, sensor kinase
MVSRTSIRKKLAYTFLVGSLLTVVLFGLAIKGILTEYFRRQSTARMQFVEDQGTRAVRTNLAIFKERLQRMSGSVALGYLSRTGILGDRFPELSRSPQERERTARLLQEIQSDAKLSLITAVDLDGRVVIRATNPSVIHDDTLMRDYSNPGGPVSSIRTLVESALSGKTITAFEVFAPEILALEYVVEGGKPKSSWKDYAAIPLRGRDIEPGTIETRALVLTLAQPILNSHGKTVGALLGGRVINKDISIVQEVRSLLQDQATIFLGQARIATTLRFDGGDRKGESMVGALHPSATRTSMGLYSERKSRGPIDGEELMGVFDPIQDHQGVAVGSLYLGRPLSSMDEIAKAQEEIETSIERRTTQYIAALIVFSMLLSVVIATIFSKRITKQIDQLRKGAETISAGNLDYRLNIKSGDEIEVLAEQFNLMAAELHESYQTLENKVEERTRELKHSQETLIQQEKMVGIGQLAAGIAHELNTPLGTIIGYGQMLREDLAAQPSANGSLNDVTEIIGQAERCRDLVKNLLNFSRRSTTERSLSDVNGIVRKILSLVEHDFELKHVNIRMVLDADLPPAKVNENEIAQVVLNLANNAVDSMPGGGDLRVSTAYEADADRIRIEVHDTGFGISESDRTRVFEPFFTTKEVGKGTGLGLSICYKIVENHMGSMEFDSVIGQGTTFRIFLPVNAEVRVG